MLIFVFLKKKSNFELKAGPTMNTSSGAVAAVGKFDRSRGLFFRCGFYMTKNKKRAYLSSVRRSSHAAKALRHTVERESLDRRQFSAMGDWRFSI